MQILILNQFYPPDMAPTGQVAHDLARCLVGRGHGVTVLCSRRGYAGDVFYPAHETRDGVAMVRLAALSFGPKGHLRKVLSYASFYLAALIRLMLVRPRPDVVLALTTPPYIGLLVRLVGVCRGWRRVHWIMDLYPDVMEAHGMMGTGFPGRLMARILRWLTRCEFGGASLVLTLAPDMAARCQGYAAAGTRVEWVPLWAAGGLCGDERNDVAAELRQRRGWKGQLVLMYSGNMGLGHRFGEFLAAAQGWGEGASDLAPGSAGGTAVADSLPTEAVALRPVVRFVFAGGGRRRGEIERFVQSHPGVAVELLPYVPAHEIAAHLRSADVLLASLEPAWVGCMLPSKLQSAFAAGRPVLFVGPSACAMAHWIEDAGAGWVVAPGDMGGLLAAVARACDPGERDRRGRAAAAYAAVHFNLGRNCTRIAEMIESAGELGRGSGQP